jgi:hypothetical protein
LVLEVTVTVTTQTTPTGVEVIVKLLVADVDDLLSVKKFVADASGAALTSMVTPCGGIADVIETVNGKSVCGAAGCTEFAGGFREMTRFASVPPPPLPPPPLSEQLTIPETIIDNATAVGRIFFILAILMNVEVSNIPPFGSSTIRPFMKF